MTKKKIYRIATQSEIPQQQEEPQKAPPKEPTPEQILEVAKGLEPPESVGIENNFWEHIPSSSRDLIHFRREVRRGIYKIIKWKKMKKEWEDNLRLKQLHDIINAQLDPNRGIRWETFSDKWDIHPKKPLEIIIKEHWIKEGGGFDVDLGYHYPHAFTVKKEND